METSIIDKNEIDQEWLGLILEARALGLTIDEIREFIYNHEKFLAGV
ncbi:DNA-binding anti-repressor SinI [Bacillus sp. BRMEA1]|nr:anti-repressor SinI family protein [Neobacillus endophyticus]NRD77038.1 DNA-binding anti-repressor SinI [Neobacillus endophyticus]